MPYYMCKTPTSQVHAVWQLRDMAIGSLPASRSAQAASHTWSPTVYMDSTCTPENNESTAGADASVEALKLNVYDMKRH